MLFKVSEKFKGSCVLPTLNKAIWAKMVLSISGDDLREEDIKDVVRKGILIPQDEDFDQEAMEVDHDVIIINNTDRVLVLGQTALRPNGSLPVSKRDAKSVEIITAAEDGLVTIISDEGNEPYVKKSVKKKLKKKSKKKEEDKVEIIEADNFVTPETGEDKKPTAKTWNFQTKESEDAIKVPGTEDFVKVGEDEFADIDFVDPEVEESKKIAKKKAVKKKATKKKTTKKKISTKKVFNSEEKEDNTKYIRKTKKGNKKKSKKVTTLQPVGEKKLPKTEMDAIIELDSRGNPLGEKPGDTLKHLIESIDSGKEVGFVDNEQKLDRYRKRTDME